jgi:hypothetical protein
VTDTQSCRKKRQALTLNSLSNYSKAHFIGQQDKGLDGDVMPLQRYEVGDREQPMPFAEAELFPAGARVEAPKPFIIHAIA